MADDMDDDVSPVKSYRSQATDAGFYVGDDGEGYVVVRMANGDVHRVRADDVDTVEGVIDGSLEDTLPGGSDEE